MTTLLDLARRLALYSNVQRLGSFRWLASMPAEGGTVVLCAVHRRAIGRFGPSGFVLIGLCPCCGAGLHAYVPTLIDHVRSSRSSRSADSALEDPQIRVARRGKPG